MAKQVFSNVSNLSSDDRFIPNRSNMNVDVAHYKLVSSENNDIKVKNDIFNLKPRKVDKYKELLQKTINYEESPIYCFNNRGNNRKKEDVEDFNKIYSEWPCTPRSYPVLSKPDIILDWPNADADVYWNIADWGSNEYLATIWSRKVFLWHNADNKQEEVIDSNIRASGALKWNHAGTQLAVGGFAGNFSVWRFPEKKQLYTASCYLTAFETCTISVFAWDLTDTVLVSGCSSGYLFVWGSGDVSKDCLKAHKGHKIISLAFDASNRYLCSTGTDSMVRVWKWPCLEPHIEITYCSPVRAIAFHPWRSSLLAVGGGLSDGSLTIWNVATLSQVACHVPERKSMVDCLTWNRITGELVSSHRILSCRSPGGRLNEGETKVLVLAGLEKVVDCIDDHDGRVLYLLWDKTGTKLATASSDECLCIWNFLGKSDRNLGSVLNRNPAVGQRKESVLYKLEKSIR